MKTKKHHLYAVMGSLLAVLATAFIWYRMPVGIGDMDRMVYCACGPAEVEFKDGKITMVRFEHKDPKPGDVIGSYTVAGKSVDMTIIFNGKPQHHTLKLDHLGLLAPPGWGCKYYALSGKSWKTKVHELLERIGLTNNGVT